MMAVLSGPVHLLGPDPLAAGDRVPQPEVPRFVFLRLVVLESDSRIRGDVAGRIDSRRFSFRAPSLESEPLWTTILMEGSIAIPMTQRIAKSERQWMPM
jgi:hypothetical protein